MQKSKSSELYLACPILFRGRKDGPDRTLLYWGFECGEGWFNIIFNLSNKIEAIAQELKKNGIPIDNLPKASQVKEKFGTLRFNVHNTSNEIQQLIAEAEEKSAITCDSCGELGSLRKNGWLRTLCDKCEASLEN